MRTPRFNIMQKFEEKPKLRVSNLNRVTCNTLPRSLKPIGLGQSACEDKEHVLYLGKSIQTSATDRFLQDAFIFKINVKKIGDALREFVCSSLGCPFMAVTLSLNKNSGQFSFRT